MKVDSEEYKALMEKCSKEAWEEETARDYEEYLEKKGGEENDIQTMESILQQTHCRTEIRSIQGIRDAKS